MSARRAKRLKPNEEEEEKKPMDSEEEDEPEEEEEEEDEEGGEEEEEEENEEEEEEEEEDEEEEEQPPKEPSPKELLVWVDLEMTGQDVEKEAIMEAAVIVTDGDLNILAEGPNLTLQVDQKLLVNMDQSFEERHNKSGLMEDCKKSSLALSDAEDQLLKFVTEHTEKDMSPLAGNSVRPEKKKFLEKYMPKLLGHLQARVVDVASVKELCRSWYPDEFKSAPVNDPYKRSLDKVKESIEELKYYKSALCKAVNVKL